MTDPHRRLHEFERGVKFVDNKIKDDPENGREDIRGILPLVQSSPWKWGVLDRLNQIK